ncbi:hypothetical protein EDC33_0773 [Salinicoccus roseus]|nr:hypothetical protein EDC33_0773 [Salinicoccus roseus]
MVLFFSQPGVYWKLCTKRIFNLSDFPKFFYTPNISVTKMLYAIGNKNNMILKIMPIIDN